MTIRRIQHAISAKHMNVYIMASSKAHFVKTIELWISLAETIVRYGVKESVYNLTYNQTADLSRQPNIFISVETEYQN